MSSLPTSLDYTDRIKLGFTTNTRKPAAMKGSARAGVVIAAPVKAEER